jgi:superfamily II DNA or RNA helicase
VLLMRPTKSLAMYLQQVGRGLRPSNKECVILDCVGNSAHHGMPDEERIWSLQGHAKIRNGLVANAPVRVCSRCFGVHRPHLRVCPFCGFSHPLDKRIPTDLELILEQKRQMKRDVGRARSVEDLERIAKERGYKRGWVDHILRTRHRHFR